MSDQEHEHPPIPHHVIKAATEGCAESRMLIERRTFLGLSAGLFAWAFAPRIADAAPGDEPRLLVVLLRGGMDGLHVVPPLGDGSYATLRGGIALTPAQVNILPSPPKLDDNFFGLHKSLSSFYGMYQAGEASIIHAIAPPLQIGSHFECQYNIESGFPGDIIRAAKDGWMNRLMANLPAGSPVRTLGALEIGSTPLITMGEQRILSWSPGGYTVTQSMTDKLHGLYKAIDPVLSDMLQRGDDTNVMASQAVTGQGTTALQQAFAGAGALLGAVGGPRIAVLNVDGWDTHVDQHLALPVQLTALDQGLTYFKNAIGSPAWQRTVVVCVTEFGRTAAVNGRSGTDHGVGTVALMAGGAVAGNKIHVDWPGLSNTELLNQRNLKATKDLRAVFKGILQDHLGVPRNVLDEKIFPGSADLAPMAGLVKTNASAMAMARAPSSASEQQSPREESAIGRFRQQYPDA